MNQGKIGEFIAKLRKEKDLTQSELGDIVGVTGKAVSRWERGLNLPDTGIMNKVSEALGITTTELLNGERVEIVNKDNIDEITKNSVEYYKGKLRKRFLKIGLIGISIAVLSLLGLFMVFYFNNSGSCNVYSIESASTELFSEGIITQTKNKTTIVISNFEYFGTYIYDVRNIYYDLLLDDEILISGNYDLDNYNYGVDEFDIKKFFNTITIYYESKEVIDLKNSKLSIKFKYVSGNNVEYDYKLPIKITKQFSNNKFIYKD